MVDHFVPRLRHVCSRRIRDQPHGPGAAVCWNTFSKSVSVSVQSVHRLLPTVLFQPHRLLPLGMRVHGHSIVLPSALSDCLRMCGVYGRAVVNSAGTVAGVVGVAVAGTMLESHERDSGVGHADGNSSASSSGWSAVFGVAAGVSYLCAGLFAVFASVDDQFRTRGKAMRDDDLERGDVRRRQALSTSPERSGEKLIN